MYAIVCRSCVSLSSHSLLSCRHQRFRAALTLYSVSSFTPAYRYYERIQITSGGGGGAYGR